MAQKSRVSKTRVSSRNKVQDDDFDMQEFQRIQNLRFAGYPGYPTYPNQPEDRSLRFGDDLTALNYGGRFSNQWQNNQENNVVNEDNGNEDDGYIVNPLTNRKIKRGGSVYRKLMNSADFQSDLDSGLVQTKTKSKQSKTRSGGSSKRTGGCGCASMGKKYLEEDETEEVLGGSKKNFEDGDSFREENMDFLNSTRLGGGFTQTKSKTLKTKKTRSAGKASVDEDDDNENDEEKMGGGKKRGPGRPKGHKNRKPSQKKKQTRARKTVERVIKPKSKDIRFGKARGAPAISATSQKKGTIATGQNGCLYRVDIVHYKKAKKDGTKSTKRWIKVTPAKCGLPRPSIRATSLTVRVPAPPKKRNKKAKSGGQVNDENDEEEQDIVKPSRRRIGGSTLTKPKAKPKAQKKEAGCGTDYDYSRYGGDSDDDSSSSSSDSDSY